MVKVDSHLFYPASPVSLSVHRPSIHPSIHPFTHPLIYGVLGELWARIYVSVLCLCIFFPNYCPSSTLTPGGASGPLPCALSLLRTYSMDRLAHALHVCVPHYAPGDVTLSEPRLAGTPLRCLNSRASRHPHRLSTPLVGIAFCSFLFFFFNKFIYLFIYGCVGSSLLCEGFLQLRRAGATLHRGARASHCHGLSLQSTGSRRAGSVAVAHGPSCSAACGIFLDQGSNPCPLHRQADSQPPRHQGSPIAFCS